MVDTNTDKANILVVDDKPANITLLAQLLTKEGYNVRVAPNGKLALNSINIKPPDLILLDIKMPEMDGYQVCKTLKNNPQTREIPVIFISALGDVVDKVKAFQCGGVDYINKPFETAEVLARVDNQIKWRSLQIKLQEKNQELQKEIEKRKEAEQIIYQSRSLLSSVLNSSLDGIAVLEAVRNISGQVTDFRCVLVNPIISKFLGVESEDLSGKIGFKLLLNKIDHLSLLNDFILLLQTRKPLEKDISYQYNNQTNWCHFIAVKLGDGFAITIRDITDRKKMELELKKVNQELKKKNHYLEASNKELETFSSRVSHDLRNPLSNIKMLTSLLKIDLSFDHKIIEYLDLIDESSQQMSDIIEGLLTLAEVNNRKLSLTTVNLSEIANKITKQLKQQEPNRKIEFIIEPNLITKGDQKLLNIALENLINNAWKYTNKQEKSQIEFGFLSKKNENQTELLIYFVRDNGVGFDMKKSDTIFTPFTRLHNDFEGVGIGLSTVQKIIHSHGGLIWCNSQVDQGATFYFTLETRNNEN